MPYVVLLLKAVETWAAANGGAAQHHALMLWEDCAECYAGLGYRGNKQADASLFSFGPIKFSTALQGGVLCLRDASLAAKARSLHSCWPIQSRLAYFLRALRFFVSSASLLSFTSSVVSFARCLGTT